MKIPTLDDILEERSREPFTLGAFERYSETNHCVEPLEFTLAVERYCADYEAAMLMPEVLRSEMDDQLCSQWKHILYTFVHVGSPMEINVPGDVRDRLLRTPCGAYGSPELFEGLVRSCKELMQENSYLNFVQATRQHFVDDIRKCPSPGTEVFNGEYSIECADDHNHKPPTSSWLRMSKHFTLRRKNRGPVAV
jgi:hypothetical protein